MGVFITSEVGCNWNQDIDQLKTLIDVGLNAGADAVKFQLWHPDTFPDLEEYRMDRSVLSVARHHIADDEKWYCTAFDFESVEYLDGLDMKYWKVPSNPRVVKRIDLLQRIFDVARLKALLFSTGASTFEELKLFNRWAPQNTTWMHCVSEYPCPIERAHLGMIGELKRVLNIYNHGNEFIDYTEANAGFSDHSGTIELPVAAVAMGATAIEVHITLDKQADGPDHKASLEPAEFKTMVKMIRNVERAL